MLQLRSGMKQQSNREGSLTHVYISKILAKWITGIGNNVRKPSWLKAFRYAGVTIASKLLNTMTMSPICGIEI